MATFLSLIIDLKKLLRSDWPKRSAFLVNTVQKRVTVQISKTAEDRAKPSEDSRRSPENFRRSAKYFRSFPKIVRQSPEISEDHRIFLKLFQVEKIEGNTFCVPQ